MIMKKKNLLPIDVQKLAPEAIPRGEKIPKMVVQSYQQAFESYVPPSL